SPAVSSVAVSSAAVSIEGFTSAGVTAGSAGAVFSSGGGPVSVDSAAHQGACRPNVGSLRAPGDAAGSFASAGSAGSPSAGGGSAGGVEAPKLGGAESPGTAGVAASSPDSRVSSEADIGREGIQTGHLWRGLPSVSL